MTNTPPSIIAIDGPAASGKSTLGLSLAQALGYLFFDTGIMYRAVTWLALKLDMDLSDAAKVSALAEQTQIDIAPASKADGRVSDILIAGQDITWETRLPEVDANVSLVSAHRGVRAALSQQQRRIGQRGKVVMVGRDIGTVVLPEADLKIYLDASAEQRAKRRYDEILAKVIDRDRIDSTRDVAPLKAAEDAIVLDSEQLNAEQVFEKVLAYCK